MITIKNNRKSTIPVLGKDLGPLQSMTVSVEDWKREFKERKPLRDAVSKNFVLVFNKETKKTINKKEK